MRAEAADYRAKARETLAGARRITALPLPHIAAREANLAVYHATEAYIFERTGNAAKSHGGVNVEFARLARVEPLIGRNLTTFLAAAYQFKTRADYAVGAAAAPITSSEAADAIVRAAEFIDTDHRVGGAGVALTHAQRHWIWRGLRTFARPPPARPCRSRAARRAFATEDPQ